MPRSKTLLSRLLLGAAVVATLGGCDRSRAGATESLLPAVPTARTVSVVSGSGPLGGCSFRPFVGRGLFPDRNDEWVQPLPGVGTARLGIFLHDVQPLKVVLEGEALGQAPRTVSFVMGGKRVASEAIEHGVQTVPLEIGAEALRPGMNWLEIHDCQDTRWLSMTVTASKAPRTLAGKTARSAADVAGESLLLAFESRLELPMTADEETMLQCEVEPWVEAGASPLELGSWSLEISSGTDETPYKALLTASESGPCEVALPVAAGPRGLALKARLNSKGTALPGQLGLRLVHPRLTRKASAGPVPSRGLSVSPAPASPLAATPIERPNVLIYLVDTLRAGKLGVYGNAAPTSPRLDALAQDSVVYDQAMSSSPWTKPAVASLMTSTMPVVHGVTDFTSRLPDDLTTLAESLSSAGYQTAGFVANPLVGDLFGFQQGFRTFKDIDYHLDAREVNAKVLPWLDKASAGTPFFLYVHTLDPHLPYNPPESFRRAWLRSLQSPLKGERSPAILRSTKEADFARLSRVLRNRAFVTEPYPIPEATHHNLEALYEGELAANDAAFGALVDDLKKRDLYDNTMIVFLSDHGEEILDRGQLGHLNKVNQELMRIPLVVKFPQGRDGGKRVAPPCQITDVMPTILAEAGLPLPTSASGKLLSLQGESEPRPLFFDIETGRTAASAGQPSGNYLIDAQGVRLGRWTAAVCSAANWPTEPFTLYDLESDPGERKNLWGEQSMRALHLESLIRGYNEHRGKKRKDVAPVSAETGKMLRSLQYLR